MQFVYRPLLCNASIIHISSQIENTRFREAVRNPTSYVLAWCMVYLETYVYVDGLFVEVW
jgi:hypothetical protein